MALASPRPTTNLPELTVSELAFSLKRTVEDAFGQVRVRGEISGFKRAASGHAYFALKDDQAVLDAVAWRGTAQRFAFKPEDGLEVICTGKLTTYPGRSRYQIVVERMEPAGAGALMALLEERKRRLHAEGLFDPARKKPLPYLPATIGVITSPTGAVIRDVLHRLAERFPLRVLLWPVAVQGEAAAEQVAAAVRGFDAMPPAGSALPRPDLLIVARGGGSIEDLWAFNEEAVVRAVAGCSIPVISAVGHETDTTLIDHVADRRAPTPTAAAEIAVPVRLELLAAVEELGTRARSSAERSLKEHSRHLDALARSLRDPREAVALAAQRLDDQSERLSLALNRRLEQSGDALSRLRAGLRPPRQVLAEKRGELRLASSKLEDAAENRVLACRVEYRRVSDHHRLSEACRRRLHDLAQDLQAQGALLEAMSHRSVLERGYAIVKDANGALVATAEAGRDAPDPLTLVFHDGELAALKADAPRPRPTKKSDQAPKDQGKLF